MAQTTLSHRANVKRISLQLGIIEPADIVAWVDDEIEASDVPASPLVDLSLGRTIPVAELVSLLGSLVTNSADLEPLKEVLRQVADRIRSNDMKPEAAIVSIYNYLKIDRDDDDLYITFLTLEDDYADIRDGIYGDGDLSVLREPLLNELDAFTSSNAG